MARTKKITTTAVNPAIIANAVQAVESAPLPPMAEIPIAVKVVLNHNEVPSNSDLGAMESRINARMLSADANCVDIGRELSRLLALNPHKQGPKSTHVTQNVYIDQTFKWGRSTCYAFIGAAKLADWTKCSDTYISDIPAIPRKLVSDMLETLQKKALMTQTVSLIGKLRHADVKSGNKLVSEFKRDNGIELTATDNANLGLKADTGGNDGDKDDAKGDPKVAERTISLKFEGADYDTLMTLASRYWGVNTEASNVAGLIRSHLANVFTKQLDKLQNQNKAVN